MSSPRASTQPKASCAAGHLRVHPVLVVEINFIHLQPPQATDYLLAACWLQSTLISSRTKLANGKMFCSADAASRASRYAFLRVVRTMVQGYPPEAIITFIKNRAIRPLPSMYG